MVCGIFGCNNPAAIDTSLVNVDLLDVQSESDFDISAFTVKEDSIANNLLNLQYPFGIYEDPVFGITTASIVNQIYLTTTSPPTFAGAVVDSVIMEVALSQASPFYGDTTGLVGLEVYEVLETLDGSNTYFNNYQATTNLTPIGFYEGVPNFRDSVVVTRYQADTLFIDTFPPLIRFHLNPSYGNEIINAGDDVLTSASEFITTFQGLELRPTLPSQGMIAFDLANFSGNLTPSVNGANVLIYYTQDGINRQYNLAVNQSISVKFEQQTQDFNGSIAQEFIDGGEVSGDSLLFVQGMSGTNAVVKLNDVDRLNGSLINGAVLEVYGTALNNDEDIRPVPDQLVLRKLDADGSLPYIRDFVSSAGAGTLSISGGTPEDMGNGIYKYTFDVVSELQDIIEGDSPNEIYIRTSAKIGNMQRVVLFGADHSTYPIKLTVTYTKL